MDVNISFRTKNNLNEWKRSGIGTMRKIFVVLFKREMKGKELGSEFIFYFLISIIKVFVCLVKIFSNKIIDFSVVFSYNIIKKKFIYIEMEKEVY